MLKLSLGWIVAGVAALGTAAYVFASGKKSSSSPKMLTKVPFNPTEDDCDTAYGQLPDDVQDAYNNAVHAANVDTSKLIFVKNFVQAIAKNPDIDDVAKRTFQKCFWKRQVATGQSTVAEAIAAVPSLATVLGSNALGEGDAGGGDDGIEGTSDDEVPAGQIFPNDPDGETLPFDDDVAEYNAPDPRLLLNQLTLTPAAYLGPWPALHMLPMPYSTQALFAVGDTNYYAAIGQLSNFSSYTSVPGIATAMGDYTNMPQHTCGPLCNARHSTVQAYADKLASMNGALFGKNGAAIRDAAVAELEAAAILLWNNGMR